MVAIRARRTSNLNPGASWQGRTLKLKIAHRFMRGHTGYQKRGGKAHEPADQEWRFHGHGENGGGGKAFKGTGVRFEIFCVQAGKSANAEAAVHDGIMESVDLGRFPA